MLKARRSTILRSSTNSSLSFLASGLSNYASRSTSISTSLRIAILRCFAEISESCLYYTDYEEEQLRLKVAVIRKRQTFIVSALLFFFVMVIPRFLSTIDNPGDQDPITVISAVALVILFLIFWR